MIFKIILTWSQVTFPNWSTAIYLFKCERSTIVSPSPEGSKIQTCFFFNVFPLELTLKPNVSALKYLNLLLMSPTVQHPFSVAAVPLVPLFWCPFWPTIEPVMAATEKYKTDISIIHRIFKRFSLFQKKIKSKYSNLFFSDLYCYDFSGSRPDWKCLTRLSEGVY